jgi:CRISPR-associated protein Cmr3
METKYNVSVTLTPLDHYFFGGENLNTDGTEKYYQRSTQLPQQTTLLGTMRFLLLKLDNSILDGNKIIDKEKAKKLIGENSFNKSSKSQYGKINAISEVLLWHETEGFYLPMLAWENTNNDINTLIEQGNNKCFFGGKMKKDNFLLPYYEAKNGTKEYWIGQDGKPFQENIFVEYRHSGNFKNKKNKVDDDEDAYFKMCYYHLKHPFSFVFNMEISDDTVVNKLIRNNHIVTAGGEQSKFMCEIKKLDDSNPKRISEDIYEKAYSPFSDSQFTKVILTADAFTEEENLYQNSLFAVTQIKKMRFMQSSVEKTNEYNNRMQGKSGKGIRVGLKQSRLFNLLKRGSVFYFSKGYNMDKFLQNTSFETIGYNKFYKL